MKRLYLVSAALLLSVTTQSFACDSIKWCQHTPNATNNFSSASYQCGCNDPPNYDKNPKLGEKESKDQVYDLNPNINNSGNSHNTMSK
ncbi:hypothetical protein SAMN04490191_3506 [Pseudomonas lini]|uniref:Uncharacterized protein n=1 Tax=Pseudomonas lini TaxID=163011 RepID=A0A1H1YHV2_9PSED|nr:hypothetical protein SAMN04490191_3506 [Pseudomonas lini]